MKHFFIKKIDQNEFMGKKHKKILYHAKLYRKLSYFSFCSYWMCFNFWFYFFIQYSSKKYTFCNWIGNRATTEGIKKYRSIIKKHEKNHGQEVLSAKTKLNTVAFLISKALIYQNISYNDFVVIKIVLKEYNKMKEQMKNPNNK